jgi:predicted DNA-binding transcriptional regulator YafY
LKDDDNELLVQLNVIINEELIMMLMSHGDHVKVIEPSSLAEKIAERCARVAAKYSDNEPI